MWNGQHPEDGSELIVENTIPMGVPPPELHEEPQLTAPGVDPELVAEIARKLTF